MGIEMGEFIPSIVSFLMKCPLIVMEKTGDENRRTIVEPFKTEHAVIEESQLRDPIFLPTRQFLLRRAYSCDKPFA